MTPTAQFKALTHDKRLELLDAETERFQSIGPLFRQRRNAYCIWCSFPPEVLCLVLEEMQSVSGWPVVPALDRKDGRNLGWIAATHVCSVWRKVAIAAPTLWAEPDDLLAMSWTLMSAVIQRSQRRPFNISFFGDSHVTLGRLDARLPQCFAPPMYDRLQELSLEEFPLSAYERVASHLSAAFPNLRTLRVDLLLEEMDDVPELPSDMQLSASLTKLVLINCLPPRWSPSFFGLRLKHLTVRCPEQTPPTSLPSVLQLATVLMSLKSLEVLTLEDVFADRLLLEDCYPAIILPLSLRFCELRASEHNACHRACFEFLAHLVPPCNVELKVDIYDPYDISSFSSGVDLPTFSTLTSTAIQSVYGHLSPAKALIVTDTAFLTHRNDTSESSLGHLMDTSHGVFSALIDNRESLITLSFEAAGVQPLATSRLPMTLEHLASISLTARGLSIVYDNPAWWDAFETARGVRRLSLCMDDCAAVLWLAERVMEQGEMGFPFFPNLDSICITAQNVRIAKDPRHRPSFESALRALEAVVKGRNTIGPCRVREVVVDQLLREWWAWDTFAIHAQVTFDGFLVLDRIV
ncbi:unnamed protein product [Peniophora sp. CBMAI 1063]|nr:unnamed protein product [Peniophora sp. CBMAI 1063]